MMMNCPACKYRAHGLISDDCPVCDGTGQLELGAAASEFYEPKTIAQAITYSLEAKAREIDVATPFNEDRIQVTQDAVRAHVVVLHEAGLIGNRHTGLTRKRAAKVTPADARGAQALANAAGQTPIDGIDVILSGAAPYRYKPEDRPLTRGLPPLSATGHPSSLARICDPWDLESNNLDHHRAEESREFHIAQLVGVAEEAARQWRDQQDRKARRKKAK